MAAAAEAILDTLKDKKVAVGGIFVVAESARYTHWLSNDELGKIIAAHGGKPQLTAINTATDVVVLGDIGARDIKCVGAPRARARVLVRARACSCARAFTHTRARALVRARVHAHARARTRARARKRVRCCRCRRSR